MPAVFTIPNLRAFIPAKMDWRLMSNVDVNRSVMNGVLTRAEIPSDMWHIRLEYGNQYTSGERDQLRAFWDGVRGQANTFRCWHLTRPEPRGTMRTATLSGAHVEGALEIGVSGVGSLLPGDFLGLTLNNGQQQLLEVRDAPTPNPLTNLLLVQLVAPLRRAATAGAAIILTRPTAEFLLTQSPFIPHEHRVSGGFSVEAIETTGW